MKKVSIQINTSLSSNGQKKMAIIQGFGYIDSGFLMGNIIPIDGVWTQSEKIFPSICMFTGCPIVAHIKNNVSNPWLATKGTYSCTRIIQGGSFTANTSIKCSGIKDGKIIMDLTIDISGKLPNIEEIKNPFMETMKPEGSKNMRGFFEFSFASEEGVVPCTAETIYTIPIDHRQREIFRTVTIGTVVKLDGTVMQHEQIDMYGNKPAAQIDLQERIRTHQTT